MKICENLVHPFKNHFENKPKIFESLDQIHAKMTDTEDVYATLKKCGLQFPTHIKNLLQKLGYKSLRSFAQEHPVDTGKLQDIEENVRQHIARPSMIDKLNNLENPSAEKIDLFGEVFSDDPTNFVLLPGDRSSIASAAELCATILKDNTIPTLQLDPMFSRKHPSLVRPQLAITPDINQGIHNPSTTKRRNLLDITTNWVKRSKFNYALADFTVCEETREIVCQHKDHVKEVKIRIVLDKLGYWKISNFSRHVMDSHKALKPIAEKEPREKIVNMDVMDNSSDVEDEQFMARSKELQAEPCNINSIATTASTGRKGSNLKKNTQSVKRNAPPAAKDMEKCIIISSNTADRSFSAPSPEKISRKHLSRQTKSNSVPAEVSVFPSGPSTEGQADSSPNF